MHQLVLEAIIIIFIIIFVVVVVVWWLSRRLFCCHFLFNRVEIRLNQKQSIDCQLTRLFEVLGALLGVWGIIPWL